MPEVQRVARYIIVRILQLHQIPTKPDIYHTATHLYNMPICISLSIVNSFTYNLAERYLYTYLF